MSFRQRYVLSNSKHIDEKSEHLFMRFLVALSGSVGMTITSEIFIFKLRLIQSFNKNY